MKSKFGIVASFVLVLLCMLFAVSCPSRSGTSDVKVTGIEFLNEHDEVITSLELEKGIETVIKVKPIPRSAVNAVINLALVADEDEGESEAAFNLNASAKKVTGNVYSARARIRATLVGANDVLPVELALSVEEATPVEVEEPVVIEGGSDSIPILLPAETPHGVEIQSSTIEPQDAGSFDPENPAVFILGQNVENGTLITVTSTLSDGSVVIHNLVKGGVVLATDIAIDTTEGDFVTLPGQAVQIPVSFNPPTCTYHDSKYITFESNDEDVVSVQDGKVCLSSDSQFGDSATITGTSRDGKQFTFEVVNNFYTPTSDYDLETGRVSVLQLLSDDGELVSGASLTSCDPANAVSLDATKGTLTISSSGVASGKLISCTIEYQDGTTRSFNIVKGAVIPLESISTSTTDLEIAVGGSDTITPVFTPSNATYQGWSLAIQSDTDGIIDSTNSNLSSGVVAIVDNETLIGKTATLTLTSAKYPSITCPIIITAVVSGPFEEDENGNQTMFLGDNDSIDVKFVKVVGGDTTLQGQSVTLSDFYICDHEVTREEYKVVIDGANPSGEILPAGKSWYNAIVFCNKLSMLKSLTPCYSINGETDPAEWGAVPTSSNATWNAVTCNFQANGFRLPTDSEWEYAARGGKNSKNYKYSGSNTANDVGWYISNSNDQPHNVKTKNPNELFLYDMSGNVGEWCWNWYGGFSYLSGENPTGPISGTERIVRGGSYITSYSYLACNERRDNIPSDVYNDLGFRIVRSAQKI